MFQAAVFLKKTRFGEPEYLYLFGFKADPLIGDVFMHEDYEYEIVKRIWNVNGRFDVIIEPLQRQETVTKKIA
jgi:hypothetical protein